LATIGGGAIGAICSGGSVTISDGDSVAIGNGGGNLDADALRMGDDMDVLLGNRTTVVLAGDDLGGAVIWRRPKRWQRRHRQRGRLWHGWRHRPGHR
jgi:hypothetical protein